jgi:hypothetical protein
MDEAEMLFTKWQGWIKQELLRDFQDLVIFKHIADGFSASLQPYNGTEPEWGDLVTWMAVNYVANTASSIRRLVDRRPDVISLHRLLTDVKQHAAVLTPQNLSKHRGNIGPWQPSGGVLQALDDDLRLLAASSDAIRVFVNKMVAHSAVDAHKIALPTYESLYGTMQELHRIYRRWALFLAGMGCQTDDPNPDDLIPMDPPDYESQFARMWKAL